MSAGSSGSRQMCRRKGVLQKNGSSISSPSSSHHSHLLSLLSPIHLGPPPPPLCRRSRPVPAGAGAAHSPHTGAGPPGRASARSPSGRPCGRRASRRARPGPPPQTAALLPPAPGTPPAPAGGPAPYAGGRP